jgi:nitric oxide reductase subunit B
MAPPIPEKIDADGKTEPFLTGDDIRKGQNVWQTMGGMQLGSIWGHGSYVAPDWTADWLHKESELLLDMWAGEGKKFKDLDEERKAVLLRKLETEMRRNGYDESTGTLRVHPDRQKAFEENQK